MENLNNIQSISSSLSNNSLVIIALCTDGSAWMKKGPADGMGDKKWYCINKGQNKN